MVSVPIETVIESSKEMTIDDTSNANLADESKKGNTVEDMKKRVTKKDKQDLTIHLSTTSENLKKIADSNGEIEKLRATQYVVTGTRNDFAQLGERLH